MASELNFNLPINFSQLENDRLKLVPLADRLTEWANLYVADANLHPSVYDYLTYGPFASGADYVAYYNTHSDPNPHELLLAIIIKSGAVIARKTLSTPPGSSLTGHETITTETISQETFAGISGIVTPCSDPQGNHTIDIGQLLLTPFHRTFVGTQANALLLHYCLDPPSLGGLGLRRVQWQANAENVASINAAKRLGFSLEGVLRWHAVLPGHKKGDLGTEKGMEDKLPRGGWDGERGWSGGRHTAMLSLCWDDWEGGGRGRVDELVARQH